MDQREDWFLRLQPLEDVTEPAKTFTLAQLVCNDDQQDKPEATWYKPLDKKLPPGGLTSGGVIIGRKSSTAPEDDTKHATGYSIPVLSRYHAQINVTRNGHVYLTDLRSMHGSKIFSLSIDRPGHTHSASHLSPVQLLSSDIIILGKSISSKSEAHKPLKLMVTFNVAQYGIGSDNGKRKTLGRLDTETAWRKFANTSHLPDLIRRFSTAMSSKYSAHIVEVKEVANVEVISVSSSSPTRSVSPRPVDSPPTESNHPVRNRSTIERDDEDMPFIDRPWRRASSPPEQYPLDFGVYGIPQSALYPSDQEEELPRGAGGAANSSESSHAEDIEPEALGVEPDYEPEPSDHEQDMPSLEAAHEDDHDHFELDDDFGEEDYNEHHDYHEENDHMEDEEDDHMEDEADDMEEEGLDPAVQPEEASSQVNILEADKYVLTYNGEEDFYGAITLPPDLPSSLLDGRRKSAPSAPSKDRPEDYGTWFSYSSDSGESGTEDAPHLSHRHRQAGPASETAPITALAAGSMGVEVLAHSSDADSQDEAMDSEAEDGPAAFDVGISSMATSGLQVKSEKTFASSYQTKAVVTAGDAETRKETLKEALSLVLDSSDKIASSVVSSHPKSKVQETNAIQQGIASTDKGVRDAMDRLRDSRRESQLKSVIPAVNPVYHGDDGHGDDDSEDGHSEEYPSKSDHDQDDYSEDEFSQDDGEHDEQFVSDSDVDRSDNSDDRSASDDQSIRSFSDDDRSISSDGDVSEHGHYWSENHIRHPDSYIMHWDGDDGKRFIDEDGEYDQDPSLREDSDSDRSDEMDEGDADEQESNDAEDDDSDHSLVEEEEESQGEVPAQHTCPCGICKSAKARTMAGSHVAVDRATKGTTNATAAEVLESLSAPIAIPSEQAPIVIQMMKSPIEMPGLTRERTPSLSDGSSDGPVTPPSVNPKKRALPADFLQIDSDCDTAADHDQAPPPAKMIKPMPGTDVKSAGRGIARSVGLIAMGIVIGSAGTIAGLMQMA